MRVYDYLTVFTSVDDSNKIANFIPAKCNNNSGCTNSTETTVPKGTLGMYDTVRDMFFTNEGTGTFVGGPEVE